MRVPLPRTFTYGLLAASYAASVTLGACMLVFAFADPELGKGPWPVGAVLEGLGMIAIVLLAVLPALAFVVGMVALALFYGPLRRVGLLRAWVVIPLAGLLGAVAVGAFVQWDFTFFRLPLELLLPGALAGMAAGGTFWCWVIRREPAEAPAPA